MKDKTKGLLILLSISSAISGLFLSAIKSSKRNKELVNEIDDLKREIAELGSLEKNINS